MRGVIHEWWPVAAVTLFTLLLVTQIPRKAIFPPTPDEEGSVTPFASFVTLDDDAYVAALQKVCPSWLLRPRAQLGGGEGRTTAFEFGEPIPEPRTLPAGAAFSVPYHAPHTASHAPAPLLPPTLARSGVEGLAEAVEAARPRDAELLELPDSLQEKGKEKTP